MHNAADPHSPPVSPELPLVSKVLVSRRVKNISPILPVKGPGWELTTAKKRALFYLFFSCLDVIHFLSFFFIKLGQSQPTAGKA